MTPSHQNYSSRFPSIAASWWLGLSALAMALPGPVRGAEKATGGAVPKTLSTFLETHCFECHDDTTTKGDLNLLDLAFSPDHPHNFEQWERVYERVRQGEMPPKKKAQPEAKAKQAFLATLRKPLMDTARQWVASEGRVKTRRLTRLEYEYTVHDLLGIGLPLQNFLPEDSPTHGFETVASGQQLSHHHLARYLEAADSALQYAFDRAFKEEETFSKKLDFKQLGRGTKSRGNYRGPEDINGKAVAWPLTLQFYGRMRATTVPDAGWYRVTLKNVHAINPTTGSVWGTLRSGECYSDAPMLYTIGMVEATKEKRDLTYEAWIEGGHMLELRPGDVTLKRPNGITRGGNVIYKEDRNLAKEGFSGIAFTGIHLERIYPNGTRWQAKQKLLPGLTKEELAAVSQSKPLDPMRLGATIRKFAEGAFRRPINKEQLAPYLDLAASLRSEPGATDRDVLFGTYRAILCSPRFLAFNEAPGKLDDHAVASRLSYMLWNTMPDPELRKLADQGKLADPKIRHQQVNRMLKDPRAERFIVSLTDQWLNLREINFTTPDRRRYRTFDPVVQDSMMEETRAFMKTLFAEDLPVTHLVDSDFTWANERLARFYGLKGPIKPGQGTQRVKLDAKGARGGLVTQGAILKVTADGSVTSPILRGVWVSERILGRHIPPPPPGVPAVEPDIRGAVSIRDQLAKHTTEMACASCHVKIDPPGFALESFDPVGLWRTKYGTQKDAAKVDPSGQTPEGKSFEGLVGWKQIHASQPKSLARGFASHLLTYATGAPPVFSDQPALEQIVANASKNQHGMRSLLHAVVASEPFLHK